MAAVALKLYRWWATSLAVEKSYPLILAGASAALPLWAGWALGEGQALLLSASITFGAIVAGFVGASLSILISLGTEVMRRIRASDYIMVLRAYLGWGLASGIIVACVSMAGLALQLHGEVWFAAIWLASMVFCLACLLRLSRTMLGIFVDPEHRP